MSTIDAVELARKLNTATRAGDLVEAYRVINRLSVDDTRSVALMAGHRLVHGNAKKVLARIQMSVAAATRARTDGFGLRDLVR